MSEEEEYPEYPEYEETEAANSIAGIWIMSIIQIVLPIVLSILWTKFNNTRIVPVLIGVGNLIVTVLIEAVLIMIIAAITSFGSFFFLFLILIFQGLPEELGKYWCFKFFSNALGQKPDSISFGIGHGGIESVFNGIQLLMIGAEDQEFTSGLTFGYCFSTLISSVSSMILHIALSVFILISVKKKNINFLLIDIAVHDFVDLFPIFYDYGKIPSLVLVEIIYFILSLGAGAAAYYLYSNTNIESQNIGLISGSTGTPQTPLNENRGDTEPLDANIN